MPSPAELCARLEACALALEHLSHQGGGRVQPYWQTARAGRKWRADIRKGRLGIWLYRRGTKRVRGDGALIMALALCNAQGELSLLERGVHALHSGLGVREYAKATGVSPSWTTELRNAAEVFAYANNDARLLNKARWLVELHSAPRWLWKPLVAKLVAEGWTVLTAARLCL